MEEMEEVCLAKASDLSLLLPEEDLEPKEDCKLYA